MFLVLFIAVTKCLKCSHVYLNICNQNKADKIWGRGGNLGPSRSWMYGSLIYNYLCDQCLSPLTLWDRIPLRRGVLNTTLCDKVYQSLVADLWFSPGTPVSFTNKTYHHDVDILLKVALNTIPLQYSSPPLLKPLLPKATPLVRLDLIVQWNL